MGTALLLCQNDSDVEFWADSSDNDEFGSNTDSDPEITDGVSEMSVMYILFFILFRQAVLKIT